MPSWGQQIRLCPHQKQVIPTAFPIKPPRQIQSTGCPKELEQGNLQAAG